jgi:hypothetical protein
MPFRVYEIYDKASGNVVYVGSTTKGLGTRLGAHFASPSNCMMAEWLSHKGRELVGIREVKMCDTRTDMLNTERTLIATGKYTHNMKGNTT